ncbi:hypothetical protein IAT38_002910 [Cryptococcus sp. DSM 104549]
MPPANPPTADNAYLIEAFSQCRTRLIQAYGAGGHPGIVGLDEYGSWVEWLWYGVENLYNNDNLMQVTVDACLRACADMMAETRIPCDSYIQWVALMRNLINPYIQWRDYPFDVTHLIMEKSDDEFPNTDDYAGEFYDSDSDSGGEYFSDPEEGMAAARQSYYYGRHR